MKKCIKIILSLIICLICMILFINNEVNATWIPGGVESRTIRVSPGYTGGYDLYLGQDHVFCIQEGQKANSGNTYRIRYYITIDGNTSNVYAGNRGAWLGSITDIVNGKLAAIVQWPDPGCDHSAKPLVYSENQQAIYGIFPTWLGVHSSYISGVSSNGGEYQDDNVWGDWAYGEAIKIHDASISNNANVSNMTKELYQQNGTYYIKVGPFNNTFVGSYSGSTVYNQNNQAISVKYGKYVGTSFYTYDSIGEVSSSGGDFYILVPADGSVSKINKVSFTVQHTRDNIVSEIWILDQMNSDGTEQTNKQGIISTYSTKSPKTTTASANTEEIDLTGDLKIQKVDRNNSNIKLSGVGFKIKNNITGKYVKSTNGSISYVDEASATEFVTDVRGEFLIENLIAGDYVAYETKNPNYGYEMLTEGQNVSVTIGSTSTHTITNQKIYMKLTGYVWEDLPWEMGKENERTELYNDSLYNGEAKDKNDKLLAGIEVILKDSAGNILQTTVTDSEGKYLFSDVLISKLGNYYIEFRYNGLCYESIAFRSDKENGSRATEGENRGIFNEQYQTISYGASNAHELTYQTSQNQSQLLYRADGDTSKYNYGYEGNTKPVSGIDDQYIVTSNTKNGYGGYLDKVMSIEDILNNGIETVENINFGIKKRKDIDLSLIKDLYSTKVTINNQEHVYNYADRFNPENYEERYTVEPKVKFGQEYGKLSYTRALYASDIHYEGDNGLKVEVTYKIGIKNTSSSLKAVINELTDYYDSKYYDTENGTVKVGKEINEDGTVREDSNFVVTKETIDNNEYQKIKISNMDYTVTNQEGCIYVQLEVRKDKIVDILGDNDEVVKLDNVVEISSYSIQDENGNTYAAIDIDSQPGNVEIGNTNTYEDDTDKAPGLKLVLQEERKISGQVFVDNTGEFTTGEIRQGDGAYTEEDTETIEGVEVKLINAQTGEIAQVYNAQTKEWVEAKATTDENGEFTIGGFAPDTYQVVYTWGDKEHPVQDYKATVVNKEVYEAKNSELEWYRDEFKTKEEFEGIEWNTEENKEIRTSDAVDNYDTRKAIDNETKIVTNGLKKEIEEYDSSSIITKMDSTTPEFKITLEYETTQTNAREEYQLDENGQIVMNGMYAVKAEGKENHVRSIDFGIVERAKQVLELDKKIKNAKIVLADGSILINAEVQDDGTLKDNPKHVVYIPQSQGANGQVKFEIDSDIVQGARLQIEYGLTAINISELDYTNQEFYQYGKGHGENPSDLVTLNSTKVIDYLDNNIATDMSENASWTVMQDNEARRKLIEEQGLLENSDEMKSLLDGTSKIVLTDKLSKDLKPNESQPVSLIGYKLLANNDETILENNAEIIQVEKSGGSTLITTPGNYIPTSTSSEYDDDKSESVVVVPPTGLEIDYMAYIILAISSLGIIVAGIILIKKLVLKK